MLEALEKSQIKTEKEYEIKSYEVNANNELKPFVLLHHFEDIAYQNAENYGFGYSSTYPNGYGWFLLKYHIKFSTLPRIWEKIKITTFPCKSNGVQCRRDFEIFDCEGVKIGSAGSKWALVDINEKRIVNPHKVLKFPLLEDNYAINTTFPKVEKPEKFDYEQNIKINFEDIDINRHVNNAYYVTWATQILDYDFLLNNSIKEMIIYYKKEAHFGIEVLSKAQFHAEENATIHSLQNKNTGEELAAMKIFWRKHE